MEIILCSKHTLFRDLSFISSKKTSKNRQHYLVFFFFYFHLLWKCSIITIKNSDWSRWRAPEKCNKSNAEVVQKAFFFMLGQRDCIPYDSGKWHTHIYPRLLILNKTRRMYTSIQPYILFALTAFQQLLVPMQMSWLSPTPNRGEVIWAAEYKWLGMIDRPSHSPPSTDR